MKQLNKLALALVLFVALISITGLMSCTNNNNNRMLVTEVLNPVNSHVQYELPNFEQYRKGDTFYYDGKLVVVDSVYTKYP